MCGICGIVNRKKTAPPQANSLKVMISSLRHRGPDSAGYYRDREAGIGMSRLSIIDLEGGDQPISSFDGSAWIVYNGEIYNYLELKEELIKRGCRFRTESDTEVFLNAFLEWGPEAFNKFNGQWAAAIWKPKKKELILSRDRVGIRPLYFTLTQDHLYFASEIKALFAVPEISREFDPLGLAETFTLWSPIDPQTVFEGVYQLPPGHYAVSKNAGFKSYSYWELEFPEKGREENQDLKENIDELKNLLIDAVRLRFTRSDVPVGAYLSGGIDSSITASLISRYSKNPLKTFSIRFSDQNYDEGSFQDEMVRRLGTEHESLPITYHDIASVFPEVVRHAERPLLRTAPAPLFLLSRLVRNNGYKVVVTGEGSDEVFGGYDLFKELRARLMLSRHPESKIKDYIFGQLYPWMDRSPLSNPAVASAFLGKDLDLEDLGLSHRSRWSGGLQIIRLLEPAFRRQITETPEERIIWGLPPRAPLWDKLSLAQFLEIKSLLSSYILSAQGDRMLMAHSVEGRFPFLDHRIMEFAGRLPARHKMMFLDEKYILKKTFAADIPESILRRPKQPYRAPDAASFFQQEPDYLEYITDPLYLREAGIFKPIGVGKLMEKAHACGGIGMSNIDNMRICAIISSMLLYDQFIKSPQLNREKIIQRRTNFKVIDKT